MNEQLIGMLSDNDIRKCIREQKIRITTEDRTGDYSFNLDKQLQLASIDLRFRGDCKRFKKKMEGNLDYEKLRAHAYTDPFELKRGELLEIEPGEIIFTTTLETINISNEFAGIITGRSSIARMGIMVHCCQEFINPGQNAPIALQIVNLGKQTVELDMRTPICQLILFRLCTPASDSYAKKGKYGSETKVMSSQLYKESKPDTTTKGSRNKVSKCKTALKEIVRDFGPGAIALVCIDPCIELSNNLSLGSVLAYLKNAPVSAFLLPIMIVLYLWSKFGKEDK